jgi:hypothetical protein
VTPHERWTRLGDSYDNVSQWAVTAVVWIAASLIASALLFSVINGLIGQS